MKNKAYVLLSLAGILWGFQPVVVKFIVAEMNPPTLVSFRYLLLSATLFLLMKITHKKDFIPPKSCWLPLIIMGITGVSLNNGSQFTGLQYSTVANATLIAAMTPAVTSLLAFVFLRERLALLQWIGIIISISGALYLISNGNLDAILHISFNLGDILFFVAQTSWAIYCLLSIRVMKKMSVLSVTAWAGVFGAIFIAIYGYFTCGLFIPALSWKAMASFAYIVWLGGVGAMIFWNIGVKNVGASTASIFLNIMPIVGIVTAAIMLNEIITIEECLGAVVILLGVYITTHTKQILEKLNWKK